MIILDTNVLSELMRAEPAPVVIAWVDKQAEATLFLTALTLAEIRFGLAVLPRGRRRSTLTATFEEQIRPLFADRILGFDETASLEYAELRAEARAGGQTLGDVDAMIAAIARAHRFGVATRDTAPFAAAGLHVIDPWGTA